MQLCHTTSEVPRAEAGKGNNLLTALSIKCRWSFVFSWFVYSTATFLIWGSALFFVNISNTVHVNWIAICISEVSAYAFFLDLMKIPLRSDVTLGSSQKQTRLSSGEQNSFTIFSLLLSISDLGGVSLSVVNQLWSHVLSLQHGSMILFFGSSNKVNATKLRLEELFLVSMICGLTHVVHNLLFFGTIRKITGVQSIHSI